MCCNTFKLQNLNETRFCFTVFCIQLYKCEASFARWFHMEKTACTSLSFDVCTNVFAD